jgi:MarR family transcriptional repressor of emrRAB
MYVRYAHIVKLNLVRDAHITVSMSKRTANLLGALALAIVDRVEVAAREVLDHGGETPAALVVIGYGAGLSNDTLRRILGLSHPGAVRLVDKLVAEGLVERGSGRDGRQVALHLTRRGKQFRSQLLARRLSAVEQVLGSLDKSEQQTLNDLLHKILAGMDTSEMQRFTICRLCDDRVCDDCPLPTSKPTGSQPFGLKG